MRSGRVETCFRTILHCWPLLCVLLAELTLFIGYRCEWWRHRRSPERPGSLTGAGMVIRGDGLGYYAWIRSLLIDGDWSFDNEFDEYNAMGDGTQPPTLRTPLGLRANPWPVGPACLWAATVVPGHFCFRVLQRWGWPWPTDGYSLPYQLLVGGTTLLASFAGLCFLYAICRRYARPFRAAAAAAFVTLGTTMVYYSAVEVSMAHGVATAVLGALVWYWLKTYGSLWPGRWFLVGILIGAATLMRLQLFTFAVLPAGEWAFLCWQGRQGRPGQKGSATFLAKHPSGLSGKSCLTPLCLGLTAAGSALALAPQLIAWRAVYGSWLVPPIEVAHNWLHPSWWQILFSENRSLFYWTPISLVACAGYLAYFAPARHWAGAGKPLLILAAAFLVQVYFLASLWGAEWFLGCAYGFRHLTESMVVLAPGLALLLERASPRRFAALCGLGGVLVVWNLLLVCAFCYHVLPRDGGAGPLTLLTSVIRLVRR